MADELLAYSIVKMEYGIVDSGDILTLVIAATVETAFASDRRAGNDRSSFPR
jgi:hypothetical protein